MVSNMLRTGDPGDRGLRSFFPQSGDSEALNASGKAKAAPPKKEVATRLVKHPKSNKKPSLRATVSGRF